MVGFHNLETTDLVVRVEFNESDFNSGVTRKPGGAERQNAEDKPKTATSEFVQAITGNAQVREMFIGFADPGQELGLGNGVSLNKGKVRSLQG